MLYNGVEVQTIKLVLSGTESTGISSKQVLLMRTCWLLLNLIV